jgi:Fe-S-cluster containining protein
MSPHYRLFSETKQQYQQLFRELESALDVRLTELRSTPRCPTCAAETVKELAMASAHPDCPENAWRKAALVIVEEEIPHDVLAQLASIKRYRESIDCHMCGQCCRLASSEHSYEQLLTRADAGDRFAQEFSSIFLPYASREAARLRDPAGVAATLAHVGSDSKGGNDEERIFFYFCPYLQEDNRCGVYGTDKRPPICATYPETPLGYVSECCAWKPWQEDTHLDALLAHAMLNLCEDWSRKLRQETT